ncbi:MAG TPA: FAD-dependent oxidoreductase [Tepidisphaeraceae bacterium]|nr:FAD-dependent oxidoreductase [Tepidisphaeraceae bacterium]
MNERKTDILIVGGGTGGVAAALGATALGYKVVLTEETDWLGGQLTSQAVPPDEHQWIEKFGCTRRYRAFRDGVRSYYREHYPLTEAARNHPTLNPGGGQVSRLCHEPRVGVAVIESMLQWPRTKGLLTVLLRHKPVGADIAGDRVRSVTMRDLETNKDYVISADYILDATELGKLLPLTKTEYVVGAESRQDTNEPHAIGGPPEPNTVQSFTWCFPMAFDPAPGANHVIDKPEQYDRWRDYTPQLTPPWPGKLLSWTYSMPVTLQPISRVLFPADTTKGKGSFWPYRKIVTSDHYPPEIAPHEVTLVNWPQNDYWVTSMIDQPQEVVSRALHEAKQLSLSFFYWLQTEAPRPDGGAGYPGLYLRPDIVGTSDGLAKYPYIRESRRIRARFTVTENHIGVDARKAAGKDAKTAEQFPDSVGVGYYRIDLHPSTGGRNYIDIASLPFQIPLGSLVPQRVENLLPACKNLGVTHLTNGCYRLHPVEWNVGEAAGLLAGFCLSQKTRPQAVHADADLLHHFQDLLIAQGIELRWPDSVLKA